MQPSNSRTGSSEAHVHPGGTSVPFLIVTLVLASALLACPGSTGDPEETASMAEERYLAAWGPYRLTVSDFRSAARWRAASSGVRLSTLHQRLLELDDDDLDSVLRDIIQRGYLLHESRNITLPDDPLHLAAEQDALVQEAVGLAPLFREGNTAPSAFTLEALAIEEDDAEDFAHALLRTRFWPALPITATSDDALREAWRIHNTRAHVIIATIANDPTPQAVSTVIRTRQDDIRAYYERHRDGRFTEPLRVRVQAIRFPVSPDDHAQRQEARARADAVRELVTPESFLELAQANAFGEDGAGTGDLDWREPRYVPGLPRIDIGDITPVIELPDAFVIYHLVDIREPEARPLDRSLERGIASALLREAGPVPEADARLQQLRQQQHTDIDSFVAAADELGFRTREVPPFRLSRDGFIPGIGRAPNLSQAVFNPDLNIPAVTDDIHHTPGWLHVAFVASRIAPDDDEYDEAAEAFAVDHALHTRAALRQQRLDSISEQFSPVIDHDALQRLLRQSLASRPAGEPPPTHDNTADGDPP